MDKPDGQVVISNLPALLEQIRERNEQLRHRYGYVGGLLVLADAKDDVPRLLAAVEAVLERHRPGRAVILGTLCARHESHRFFSITRTEADAVQACPDCPATVYTSCAGCGPQVNMEACPVREAIRSALTGQAEP